MSADKGFSVTDKSGEQFRNENSSPPPYPYPSGIGEFQPNEIGIGSITTGHGQQGTEGGLSNYPYPRQPPSGTQYIGTGLGNNYYLGNNVNGSNANIPNPNVVPPSILQQEISPSEAAFLSRRRRMYQMGGTAGWCLSCFFLILFAIAFCFILGVIIYGITRAVKFHEEFDKKFNDRKNDHFGNFKFDDDD